MVYKILKPVLKITDSLAQVIFWLFGVGLLVWLPLRWQPGDSFWPVRLVNYAMPWLLLGLTPGLLYALFTRRRKLAATLLIPTLVVAAAYAPLFLPRTSPAQAGHPPLRVMSYNIWAGNKNIDVAAGLIREEQPDILLLQEVTPLISRQLFPALSGLYSDAESHILYDALSGQAIVSRYPLTAIEADYKKGRVLKAVADTSFGPVSVWNVHPAQPFPWSRHYQQIQALASDIAAVQGPLIVGGDFNTTDQSETYRLIRRYLRNAHWEAGWGFGFSFPSADRQFEDHVPLPSLLRIDHIFYSDDFYPLGAATLASSGGSDHRPVIAELSPAAPH